jgi:MFS family permease
MLTLAPCAQACFLLLCGRLADLYGRKLVWLIGYLILVVFGIGAGFAQCTFSPVRFGAGYVILTH